MAKLWRQGFPGFVEAEMNRWSMKDFKDSEKSLYDIVIIDMSCYTFVQTYIMYKNQLAMQETWGLIPMLRRSLGDGHSNPVQYSCLENPMDRGACWVTVHGITKSQKRLSDLTYTYNV